MSDSTPNLNCIFSLLCSSSTLIPEIGRKVCACLVTTIPVLARACSVQPKSWVPAWRCSCVSSSLSSVWQSNGKQHGGHCFPFSRSWKLTLDRCHLSDNIPVMEGVVLLFCFVFNGFEDQRDVYEGKSTCCTRLELWLPSPELILRWKERTLSTMCSYTCCGMHSLPYMQTHHTHTRTHTRW